MMNIDLWLDFSCPYCYIGKHNLDIALNEISPAVRQQIAVNYRSFELDPDVEGQVFTDVYAQLAHKYHASADKVKQMTDLATRMGVEAGLTLDFDKVIPVNTFKAHQLMQYAQRQETGGVMLVESLYQAYFTWGMDINDEDTLCQLAQAAGLDAEQCRGALSTDTYEKAVRLDEIKAQQLQINSIPFFIFDNQLVVTGVQPIEAFLQVIGECLAAPEGQHTN